MKLRTRAAEKQGGFTPSDTPLAGIAGSRPPEPAAHLALAVAILAAAFLTGPGCAAAPSSDSLIVAAGPLFQCAAAELLGPDAETVSLAGPGMCPGHFDISPGQAQQLGRARLLLRFDFQKELDSWMGTAGNRPPRIVPMTVSGGLAEPASFTSLCRQAAAGLTAEGLLDEPTAAHRLSEIDYRMETLEAWAVGRVAAAGLDRRPVLASRHQAAFCRLLGLDVKGEFPATDTAGPAQVQEAVSIGIASRVKLIIANRPEGRQAADALAERLGARVVVFDNFPNEGRPNAFDAMVRGNVERLTAEPRP
jgi:zinc transport system substrate-binding protein